MFKNVIVKTPCSKVTEGITTANLGKPVYEKALKQHQAYIEALKQCGVQVTLLPADEEYPDSCFVEDVAVVTEKCAIITNPGAPTRKGEIENIGPVLEKFYDPSQIAHITAPGTLEGGDVMRVDNCFYVGRSARTNAEGIRQFAEILARYGYDCREVPLEKVLHLKTGVNYLADGVMLVSGEFIDKECFSAFRKIIVPPEESYAANCIYVNGTVLVPAGFPKTRQAVEAAGFPVLPVDTSEFRKIDGGLSCLSLRF